MYFIGVRRKYIYMMASEFLTKIKSVYPSLTPSEQIVAKYILENYQNIVFTSLSEFSEECGVGEATIFRFFKKIGFSGYHDFKTNMAKNLRNPKEPDFRKKGCGVYNEMIQMLDETMQLTDIESLRQAAKWIKESQTIYLFGVGFSGLAAQGAQGRLMRLGYKAYSFTEQHIQLVSSHLITEKDTAIAFSITGDTIETLNCLKNSKQNNAKTIAITNHSRSPITKIADLIIYTAGKEVDQEGSTLITEMSQLFIIEQICYYLFEIDEKKIKYMKEKISRSIK